MNTWTSTAVSDAAIRDALSRSNLSELPRASTTTRWPADRVTVYINMHFAETNPALATYSPLVEAAMETINDSLGMQLLQRGRADADIWVHFGTAYFDPTRKNGFQQFAANVSDKRGEGGQINFYDGEIASGAVINIGHDRHPETACNCTMDLDTVIHEFGHALGLWTHFDGFGEDADGKTGPPISPAFWDVLATLYAHPPCTPIAGMLVKRARQ